MEVISVKFNGKKIKIPIKRTGVFTKGIGLMFKSRDTRNLLFEFRKETYLSIHSFFVFFDFLALWLDDKNNVLDFKIIKPFCPSVKPKFKFRKLIEMPLNDKNSDDVSFFVDKERFK